MTGLRRVSAKWFPVTVVLLILAVIATLGPFGAAKAGSGEEGWQKGATSKSGMTEEEHQSLLGGPMDPDVVGMEGESGLDAYVGGASASWDWRNVGGINWMTPVTDQLCNDCWAHAACGSMEARLRWQRGGAYGYQLPIDLSERFVVSCSGHGCANWNMPATLEYMKTTGVVDEDCLPYDLALDCDDKASDWNHRVLKVTSYGTYSSSFITNVKASVEYYGPIAVWMMVYSDFWDYSGGIYTVSGTAYEEGGHFVDIVGWDTSGATDYWICKNSWGTGWGDDGYFYIRMGTNESRIEEAAYWLTPQTLSNLTPSAPTGWSSPIVPRSTNDATADSCALTSTLPGNTAGTYLNANWTNTGTVEARGNASHIFLDGVYIYWMSISYQPAAYDTKHLNWGPVTVRGGRHTIGVECDSDGVVWESSESDQAYYRQLVWSPLDLADDTPVVRSAPPIKDAYGNASGALYNNCDGFSSTVESSGSNKWWSAIGILSSGSTSDYDVRLWDIGDYTGSQGGFGAGYIESSTYGGSGCDFVMVNRNVETAGTYYPGVINYSGGTSSYAIEEATSTLISTGWSGPYTSSSSNVLDMYEVYLPVGKYRFTLDQTAGTCDLGMNLYDDETTTARRSGYMAASYLGGDGADESFVVSITDAGYHGLAVYKLDSSDFSKTSTYRIGIEAFPSTAPTLVSPADGAFTRDYTPALDWTDVTDPLGVTYDVQIDNDSDFSSLAAGQTGLATSTYTLTAGEALSDGLYYWRARVVNGAGLESDWSGTWTFTVDTVAPPVPALVYPANGAITKDNTPWLDWSSVTDATGVRYRLQVDNDADFSSPVVSKSGITSSSRTLTALADGTYFWRVKAVDGAGNASAWTAAWSLTIDTVTPSTPALLYPPNGRITADTTPWLDWSGVTDSTGVRYQLQVDDNADFSSPVLNKTGLTSSSRTLGALADGTYYWRVRAVDGAANYTPWTAAWSFTIDTVTPAVPTLLYPADGTVTTDTTPWLDWTDETDTTGVTYKLQVDNNADFSSPVVNKSGLTLSSRTLSTLAAGTYYWRVRVVDGAGNTSSWATPWSFTVQ